MIACRCGKCSMTAAGKTTMLFLRCGGVECRQEFLWGTSEKVPNLSRTGRSTKIYFIQCDSVLGVDHSTYQNSVLLNLPDHCANHCDLSIPLSACLNMIDYSTELGPLPIESVPLFATTRFPQERKRLLSLSGMADTLRTSTEPLRGLT